jgi:hypothetical protein
MGSAGQTGPFCTIRKQQQVTAVPATQLLAASSLFYPALAINAGGMIEDIKWRACWGLVDATPKSSTCSSPPCWQLPHKPKLYTTHRSDAFVESVSATCGSTRGVSRLLK